MNVSLTDELEKLVQDKVASGLYNNQSEVVREALRLLAEQDRLRAAHVGKLQKALAEGLRQADAGDLLDGKDVVSELKAMLEERRDAKKRES